MFSIQNIFLNIYFSLYIFQVQHTYISKYLLLICYYILKNKIKPFQFFIKLYLLSKGFTILDNEMIYILKKHAKYYIYLITLIGYIHFYNISITSTVVSNILFLCIVSIDICWLLFIYFMFYVSNYIFNQFNNNQQNIITENIFEIMNECFYILFDNNKHMKIHYFKKSKMIIYKNEKILNDCCCICLDNMNIDDTINEIIICKHIFHNNCLIEWLKQNTNCPLCRNELR